MATTTKQVVNLFATSVKVKEPATKKPEKKVIKGENLGDKCARYASLKQIIETSTGELKMLEGDIKAAGRSLFMQQYISQKSRPESFSIQDDTGASCLFICMDKYTGVDQDKAEILQNYEGLLTENVAYTVNAELVEKYGAVLSQLIMNSKQIAEEDKGNLIKGELTYSIAKGSIDRLMLYPDPAQVFELVNPICQLKK